jgi:heme-degrading monooxygenase HmoA
MDQPIRILVWHGSRGEGARLTEIYHEVSRALAGAPGLLGNELLRSNADPDRYVIMSEWTSLAAFQAWDATPDHQLTAPLREYRATNGHGRPFEMFDVVGRYAYPGA